MQQTCPEYIYASQMSEASDGLKSTMLMNVIRMDGAQVGDSLGSKETKKVTL